MKIRGVDVSEQPNVFGLPMCGSYAYSIFPESGRKQFKVELSLESGEGSNRFLGLSCLRHRVKLPTVLSVFPVHCTWTLWFWEAEMAVGSLTW